MILLLLQTVRAIFDNVCTSTYSTAIGFLNHNAYFTITYFSSITKKSMGIYAGFEWKFRILLDWWFYSTLNLNLYNPTLTLLQE